MPQNEELQRHTLNLYSGDYARLQELYPDIGAGAVIRRVMRQFLERVETSAALPDNLPEIKL